MVSAEKTVFYGIPYVLGSASATLIAADLELSFWGGVDQKTSEIIDRYHPLSGRFLKDAILAIPAGRGSCGGSVIMMELMLGDIGPKALIFERPEEIITLGVMVAEEFFGQTAPVVVLKSEDFHQLLGLDGRRVHVHGNKISERPFPADSDHTSATGKPSFELSRVQLSEFDRATLVGDYGKAAKIAMKIIVRMAQMMGAQELMNVSQAHVDCAWYGPASLALGQKLRDWGGRFRVPTTLNSSTVDQRRWKALGIDTDFGSRCDELSQAFLDMGGDNIAWGESSAIIYANSVLGARTLKCPNILECLIALSGRAPKAGVYLTKNRKATICIRIQPPNNADDAFWPILGYQIGTISGNRIPVMTGLENMKPSSDDLKAFSAAFATSSSAPMFHMVNLTPEAPTLEAVCTAGMALPKIDLHWKDLECCWNEFNNGSKPQQVDIISLGNPHFSCKEIKQLGILCQGKVKHEDVSVIVTCGRAQHSLATQAGYIAELEKFGVQFLTDTCWCYLQEPIVPERARVIMTNSGKYIHYGPGLTGRKFCFGSLGMCVEVACSGISSGAPPKWLQVVLAEE